MLRLAERRERVRARRAASSEKKAAELMNNAIDFNVEVAIDQPARSPSCAKEHISGYLLCHCHIEYKWNLHVLHPFLPCKFLYSLKN